MLGFNFRVSEPPPTAEYVSKQTAADDYSIALSEK
jgi:hypothetical protein